MNNSRGRYPPGIGSGRGGVNASNPSFQSSRPQQQYVQRNFLQNHYHNQQFQQQQQQQQQQQWLRRNNFPGADSSIVDEVEKTVQSEAAVDPRSVFVLHSYKIVWKDACLGRPCFMRLLIFSWEINIIMIYSMCYNVLLGYVCICIIFVIFFYFKGNLNVSFLILVPKIGRHG